MSGLTVPRALVSAGRTSRAPGDIPLSPVGEGVEGLGKILLDLGATIETNRAQRNLEKAELEAARGFNELRAEVGQMEDPFEAEEAWQKGVGALRSNLTGGQAPLVGRRNADDFDLAFTRMRDQHAAALGPAFLLAQVEARKRTLDQLGAELGESWLAGDDRARRDVEDQFGAAVERQVQAGLIAPEAASRMTNEWLNALDERDPLRSREVPEDMPEPVPVPAEIVAARMAQDADLARLARFTGYTGADPDEAATLAARFEALDALPPKERREAVKIEIEDARRVRLLRTPKPYRHAGGPIDRAALVASAKALRGAWRAGRLSAAEFSRQAALLRDHEDLLDV